MGRPHLHVDWAEAVAKVAAAEGEWVLVASDIPERAVRTVKQRENMVLRAAGRMDARMLETYGSPKRGDLWMRSADDWKPPRKVGDSMFRPIHVPLTTKEQVFRRADEKGVSVSALVDNALARIARRGRREEDPDGAVIAANVSTKKWTRALQRAEQDGFQLAVALREELLYEARRRK